MANYAVLKAAIEDVIKTNGNNEITGQLLQNALIAIIEALGAKYQFAGIATPGSSGTNPGTPDYNVMYIAGVGSYPNFGGTDVEKGHIGVFVYNGSWDYATIETGAYFEFEEYLDGAAVEFTFYDSENPDGVSFKINKDVSGISNAPDEAISQWWAAQMKWKLQDVQGYTDTFPSLSTSVQSLGLFGVIKTGKVIDSITGANKLIFIAEDTTEYVVTPSDLPYKALADLVAVKLESGTASNVSIHVRGEMDMLISHININEIANHPAAYANAATALGDVPTLYRRKGMKVVYFDDTQQTWIEMLNIDDAGANWWTDLTNNWVIDGPIETEIPTNTGGQQLRVGGTKRGNLDDVLNVNVWNNQATEYATQAAARAAVPANKRKLGAIITYLVSTGTDTNGWMIDEFIGSSISDWTVADNWKNIGPVIVTQNTITLPDWTANTEYFKGNQIQNNGHYYYCTTSHTSGSTFDISNGWEEITDFELGGTTMQLVKIGNENYPIYQNCIKLTGFGTSSEVSGANNPNDVWYNTSNHLLRKLVNVSQRTNVTMPYVEGAIYTCNGELYKWDGANLVNITDNVKAYSTNLHENTLIDLFEFVPKIEQGGINSTTGEPTTQTNRIRTADYISGTIQILANGGKVYIFGYQDDNTFVASSGWRTDNINVSIDGANKYKIMFAKNSDDDLTPTDFADLDTHILLLSEKSFDERIKDINSVLGRPFEIEYTRVVGKSIIAATGAAADSITYDSCDFIDIQGYTSLIYSRIAIQGGTSVGVAFYDEKYKYISGESALGGQASSNYVNSTISVPSEAKYFRATLFKNRNDFVVALSNVKSVLLALGKDNGNLIDLQGQKERTKITPTIVSGKSIVAATGVETDSTIYNCTNEIDVSELSIISYSRIDAYAFTSVGAAFYDSSHNFIKGILARNDTGHINYSKDIVIVPPNAKYFRMTVIPSNSNYFIEQANNKDAHSVISTDIEKNKSAIVTLQSRQTPPYFSSWMYAARKRFEALALTKWEPLALIPGTTDDFEQGVEYQGLPYSSTREIDKYVGYNVRLWTFLTAVHNPYSVLYTENILGSESASAYGITYHGTECATYMGIQCTTFVDYIVGMKTYWLSHEYDYAEKMGYIVRIGRPRASSMKPFDIMWKSGHDLVITDIEYNEDGTPAVIEVADSISPLPQIRRLLPSTFDNAFNNAEHIHYRIAESYNPSREFEDLSGLEYNDDICTFLGDYACFRKGSLMVINYTAGSYTSMQILNEEGEVVLTKAIISNEHSIDITADGLSEGLYTARLSDGINNSEPTHFEVVSVVVSISVSDNNCTINFDSANGQAVYVDFCKERGDVVARHEFTPSELLTGQATINFVQLASWQPRYTTEDLYVKVLVKGLYGMIPSEMIQVD